MRWPFRRSSTPPRPAVPRPTGRPHARPFLAVPAPGAVPGAITPDDTAGTLLALDASCATCGRSDLPFVAGWDDLTCLECDAALNFDHELMSGAFDDHD